MKKLIFGLIATTKGIYSLDSTIGNFGGYKIPVSVK